MTIIWNDNLKTGISSIDEQHKSLFETANKLEKSKESEDIFSEVLIELQTYIANHFKTEEEYMRYTGYPCYDAHKKCHEDFAKTLSDILRGNSLQTSIMSSREGLVMFVENWIKNHYSDEDVKMAEYLNNQSYTP